MTANPGDIPESQPRPRGRVPADTFANRLLLARRMNGLTIKQAAELIQVEGDRDVASSWSNWENGRKPRDEADTMRACAQALDVDEEWLMFGGPLSPSAPPRRAAKRSAGLNGRYQPQTERPRDNRPNGRPAGSQSPKPQRADQRRPVRISRRDDA